MDEHATGLTTTTVVHPIALCRIDQLGGTLRTNAALE